MPRRLTIIAFPGVVAVIEWFLALKTRYGEIQAQLVSRLAEVVPASISIPFLFPDALTYLTFWAILASVVMGRRRSGILGALLYGGLAAVVGVNVFLILAAYL